MKKQKFIPQDLQSHPKTPGFYGISRRFYHTANELLKNVNQGQKYSPNILPSIILFTTAIESYFNEIITVNLLVGTGRKDFLDALRFGYYLEDKLKFKEKIKTIFAVYDKHQKGIDTNGEVYQDLVALISLRNNIVHYVPDFENIYNYPIEFDYITKRTHLKLENSDWTTSFSTIEIGNWAKVVVKNTLVEFSKITGAQNPFSGDEQFKSARWED